MMRRYLARCIIDRHGQRYPLSLLTLTGDGNYSISSFEKETAATVYVNATLQIGDTLPEGYRRKRKLCEKPPVWECEIMNQKKT